MENPTVGYSIGMIEGFLEGLIGQGDINAENVLGYLKVIEQAYIEKTREIFMLQEKLEAIQLNLNGWKKIE